MACATTIAPLSRDEAMHRRLLDYNPEAETFETIPVMSAGGVIAEAPLSDVDEMELAAGLLGVTNETELKQFLGDVIDQASRAIGKAVPPGRKDAIAGLLTSAAKQALPVIDRALKRQPGLAPGADATTVVHAAARYLGLELEGLSPEDQEFEAVKQFIRFAADAATTAVTGPASLSAQAATAQAARRYAPGLHSSLPGTAPTTDKPSAAASSGRWVRRGPHIIVVTS
jgi:hypothetical protein